MRTANYTELRNHLEEYLDSVVENVDTLLVNRGGGTGVVLISLDEYNSLTETEYIMSSPKTMEDIRQGEADLRNGKGIEVALDEL